MIEEQNARGKEKDDDEEKEGRVMSMICAYVHHATITVKNEVNLINNIYT